ncbi:MAG TPA: SMP-30/gluconolactonase/LRE family protein, partial [Alphaproteobacteria bacterium]|nr:SMP-30/gluconolactonase/LRE family protein [Alphaproteobacteria bacterium]
EGMAGRPDGGCCDADGCYWSAHIDGWQIVRYTPDGRIDRTIVMPVKWPTMCAFGGPGLDTLYITSLRRGGPAADHPDQPLAGSLFACRPGVTGLAEPRFAG